MSKTPDPIEVVRDKVVPAAEELVAAVAERVSPLAKEAVDQVTPVAHAAAEKTAALVHAAAEKVGPLSQQTRDAVSPYTDRVGPLAQQAAVVVGPYAALVKEQGLKTGLDLAERLEPAYGAAVEALAGARDKVSERAGDVLPAVGAAATSAAASATPLVAAATDRGKALLRSGKSEPVVVAPPKRRRGWLRTFAVVAAAAGATYVVVRRLTGDKGSQWQTARPSTPYTPPAPSTPSQPAGVSTVAEAGSDQNASAGQTTYGGTSGDQATHDGAAEASTISLYGTGVSDDGGADAGTDDDAAAIAANTSTTDHVADVDEATPPVPAADDASTETSSPSSQGARRAEGGQDGEGSAYRSVEGSGADDEPTSPYGRRRVETELETVEERVYEEPEDAVLAEQDQEAGVGPEAHPERYLTIPGVYLGVEPPEGYHIKGNERSMKYHLPDSNSYGRTIAEIWFLDEDAAQKAGFSKADH